MSLGTTCPLCSQLGDRIFQAHRIWIRKCRACTHHWAELDASTCHVERVYDDTYFSGGEAGYADYFDESHILRKQGQFYGNMVAEIRGEPGSVLDIGAAAGFHLQGFRDVGWAVRGIEPNASMTRHANRVLKLDVINTSLEQLNDKKTYDLVTMLQVLPHLVDPVVGLNLVNQVLKPEGYLLLESWDRESMTARLFGRYWHEYSPPSVLHWFAKESTHELAGKSGFSLRADGRPKKRISGAHAKSLISHKLKLIPGRRLWSIILRTIPDRLYLPYLGGDVFWALYTKVSEPKRVAGINQ